LPLRLRSGSHSQFRLPFRRHLFFFALLLLALLVLTAPWWLVWPGRFLVKAGAPVRADAALVLGGDYSGRRVLKAAQLARDGFVPVVLLSGADEFYGVVEGGLMREFAIRSGFPAPAFEVLEYTSVSTRQEAELVLPELQKRGIRSILLVTSDFHTRRAGAMFRRHLEPAIRVHVVAAEDEWYRPHRWWENSESRERFVYEWIKTLATWAGLN
jgi:uncharacterized SAM-binding protein YcdF (DUF218 family)